MCELFNNIDRKTWRKIKEMFQWPPMVNQWWSLPIPESAWLCVLKFPSACRLNSLRTQALYNLTSEQELTRFDFYKNTISVSCLCMYYRQCRSKMFAQIINNTIILVDIKYTHNTEHKTPRFMSVHKSLAKFNKPERAH